jgi:polygalacturonase
MKKCRIFILFIFISTICATVKAKEYKASLFGIKSDGVTNNTSSIQKAINYIHKQGGGTLVFYVGRYLTGTVHLRSNVNIKLAEGAVLVGASSPFDYDGPKNMKAILVADGQSNISIYGKGVIEGSSKLATNAEKLRGAGYIKRKIRPALISFSNCKNVSVKSVNLWYGLYMALKVANCKIVKVKGTDIDGKGFSSSGGLFLKDCKWIDINNVFIKVGQEPVTATNNKFLKFRKSITEDGKPLSESLK